MIERLIEIRHENALSQANFAKRLGISPGNVGCYESGRSNVSNQLIKLISYEFGINEKWIIDGHGEKYRSKTPSLDECLENLYNSLQKEDQELVLRFIQLLIEQRKENTSLNKVL